MSDLQTPRPMDERRKTYLRLIAEICIAIVSVVAVALLGGPVVGILLPFILAFIMAWMFNPIIAWLQRRLRLTRKLFSYILVLVFYALLFGLWHLGYADAVAWRIAQPDMGGGMDLAAIMAGKVLFGTAIGVVFGALRLRWGTCLPSGILHGIWNTLA